MEFFLSEHLCHGLHIHEVVMDASTLYESILALGNKLIHLRLQPSRKNLGNELGKEMYKAYRPKVLWSASTSMLGQ